MSKNKEHVIIVNKILKKNGMAVGKTVLKDCSNLYNRLSDHTTTNYLIKELIVSRAKYLILKSMYEALNKL